MQHVKFGRTGLSVSRLCLGTMTFGGQCDESRSHAILDAATEGGIDFLDTANVYPMGGGPRKSSALGSKASAIGSSSRPSARGRSVISHGTAACRASMCWTRSTRRCAA